MKKKLFVFIISLLSFIYVNGQENILTINVTKGFEGELVDNKIVYSGGYDNDDTLKQIINIEKREGFLMFKNSLKAHNTFSYGPIEEIIYKNPSKDLFSTQFLWNFSNSYNDNKGLAYVDIKMVKNKLKDKNKIFTVVLIILLDNSILQYEGYINSKDFIKIK